MRDESGHEGDRPGPSALESTWKKAPEPPIPEGLLGRCLATIPATPGRPASRARPGRPIRWIAAVAATLLLAGLAGLLARPRPADAAEWLRAVGATWAEVPASHQVVRSLRPDGTKTEETWFVRGKGHRKEVRSGDALTLVVVRNRRWEFRWDVRERAVAAWSSELVGDQVRPEEAGLVLESEGFLRWAESHRAEIRIEPDTLEGRQARKVVLRWPGNEAGGALAPEQVVWFDPDSLRPLKQRLVDGDGQITETIIDYPTPGAVPDDLFAFRPTPDLSVEINDPDLGRQVHSQRRAKAVDPTPSRPKGAGR